MLLSVQFEWDIMLCYWVSGSSCCEGTHSLWNVRNCSLSNTALSPRWHNSSLWSCLSEKYDRRMLMAINTDTC